MIPNGLAAGLAFVIFVAPGAAFQFVLSSRQPRRRETAFTETNRVILVSILSTGTASVIVGWLPTQWRASWRDEVTSALTDSKFLEEHLYETVGVLAIEVLLAVSIAAILAWQVSTRIPQASIKHEPLWHLVFARHVPSVTVGRGKARIWVIAQMADGHRYMGRLLAYEVDDIPPSERELVLGQPLFVQGATGGPAAMERVERFIITGRDIESLCVTYYVVGRRDVADGGSSGD